MSETTQAKQSAPFDNPATAPDRSHMVRADPHQPDFWVITDYRFYQHGTIESAIAERERLGRCFPQKGFYILHAKRRLHKGNARETIEQLRTANGDLIEKLKRLLNAYDEERQAIDVSADPGCLECTVGTTPHDKDTGPCALHAARAAIAKASAA